MEENYWRLIKSLEQSVKKNGEGPLTNKHLLNILKLTQKNIREDAEREDIRNIGFDPHWDY